MFICVTQRHCDFSSACCTGCELIHIHIACCSYFGLSVLDLFCVNKQLAWEIEKKDVPCTIADRCSVISELLCIKFKFLNMPLLCYFLFVH